MRTTCIASLLLLNFLCAQAREYSLDLSNPVHSNSIRSNAMAGSLAGYGHDLSNITTNPAGIAYFDRSTFEAHYQFADQPSFNFTFLKVFDRNAFSRFRYNAAFAISRYQNLDRTQQYGFEVLTNNAEEQGIAYAQAKENSQSPFKQLDQEVGFFSLRQDASSPFTNVQDYTLSNRFSHSSLGESADFSLALGLWTSSISWGITASYQHLNQKLSEKSTFTDLENRNQHLSSQLFGAGIPYFKRYTRLLTTERQGHGFDLKIGSSYFHREAQAKYAIALHSPKLLLIETTENRRVSYFSDADIGDSFKHESQVSSFLALNEQAWTPPRLLLSMGQVIGNMLLYDLNYEFTHFAWGKKPVSAQNALEIGDQHTIKVGAELKLGKLYARVGLFSVRNSLASSTHEYHYPIQPTISQFGLSMGAGYKLTDHWELAFAFQSLEFVDEMEIGYGSKKEQFQFNREQTSFSIGIKAAL